MSELVIGVGDLDDLPDPEPVQDPVALVPADGGTGSGVRKSQLGSPVIRTSAVGRPTSRLISRSLVWATSMYTPSAMLMPTFRGS